MKQARGRRPRDGRCACRTVLHPDQAHEGDVSTVGNADRAPYEATATNGSSSRRFEDFQERRGRAEEGARPGRAAALRAPPVCKGASTCTLS